MASYRVQYTEIVPGGTHYSQCDIVRGTLADVRDYFDERHIYGRDPITVIEYTQSDSMGRIVPASEWDVLEDES